MTEKENFLLPKTEASIQKIIGIAQCFFIFSRMSLYALYFIYSLVRVFVYKNYFWINVSLSAVAFVLALFYFLNYFSEIEFHPKLELAFKILWRLASLALAVFMFKNLVDFAAGKDIGISERVFAFEIIFTLLCLLGWTLAVLGDVFNMTVPIWTEEILSSFKSDIELVGLANRSLQKAKEAGGRILKKAGPKIAKGVGISTAALALKAFRRYMRGK